MSYKPQPYVYESDIDADGYYSKYRCTVYPPGDDDSVDDLEVMPLALDQWVAPSNELYNLIVAAGCLGDALEAARKHWSEEGESDMADEGDRAYDQERDRRMGI